MLIEQVRYYFEEADRNEVLRVRRQESRIREQLEIAPGVILVPDAMPADEPMLAWQCGYQNEAEMGNAEQALLGSEEYETVRNRLAGLVTRVEMELFVVDDEEEISA